MTPDDATEFRECFRTLCLAFGKHETEELAVVYFATLAPYPVERVVEAMTQAIRVDKRLPAPGRLGELILEAQRYPGRLQSKRKPRALDLLAATDGALAHEAVALIRRRLAREIMAEEYVAACRDLETKYPGIGWAETADTLEREYRAKRAAAARTASLAEEARKREKEDEHA